MESAMESTMKPTAMAASAAHLSVAEIGRDNKDS